MNKGLIISGALALSIGLGSLGCQEWLVGSPCVAETDRGEFVPLENPGATTYAIETRSVQCKGTNMVCLTATHRYPEPTGTPHDQAKTDYEKWQGTHVKYSFCSCRCKDAQGHTYDRNSDKYSGLCECPWNTRCVEVLGTEVDAPDKVQGSYCLPDCVACGNDPTIEGCQENDICTEDEVCTPSSNSDKPWRWSCKPKVDAGA